MSDNNNYQIYVWGANSHGQLGLGHESEMCWLPEALRVDLLPERLQAHGADALVEIRGGGGHVLMVTRDGAVFVGGWNNRGQLGVGTLTDSSRLTELDGTRFGGGDAGKVCAVRAGWDCSAAITEAGDVYVWGSNVHGQLGVDGSGLLRCAHTPRKLQIPCTADDRCVDVHFGLRFTVFVTRSALYITAPAKLLAQLTQTIDSAHRTETLMHPETGVTFAKVHVSAALHVACGVKHLLFTETSQSSRVHCCGDNRYGQCEVNGRQQQKCSSITDVDDSANISQLRSGWTHSGALRRDGTVLLWGRNDYGQLGGVDVSSAGGNVLRFEGGDDDARVIDLQLGAEHGAVLRTNGEVWTWGWNEHGNCGNGSEENVFEPVRVQLPGRCGLIGVGCGFCVAVVETGGTAA